MSQSSLIHCPLSSDGASSISSKSISQQQFLSALNDFKITYSITQLEELKDESNLICPDFNNEIFDYWVQVSSDPLKYQVIDNSDNFSISTHRSRKTNGTNKSGQNDFGLSTQKTTPKSSHSQSSFNFSNNKSQHQPQSQTSYLRQVSSNSKKPEIEPNFQKIYPPPHFSQDVQEQEVPQNYVNPSQINQTQHYFNSFQPRPTTIPMGHRYPTTINSQQSPIPLPNQWKNYYQQPMVPAVPIRSDQINYILYEPSTNMAYYVMNSPATENFNGPNPGFYRY